MRTKVGFIPHCPPLSLCILLFLLLLLCLLVDVTHELNPSNFRHVDYHCSSAYVGSTRAYSMTYFTNYFLSQGQLTIRSFYHDPQNIDEPSIVQIGLAVMNVTIAIDGEWTTVSYLNKTVNSSVIETDEFTMRVSTRVNKDAYYQKHLKYFSFDFSRIKTESVYFTFFKVNNTMTIPNGQLCKDYTESRTVDYYFQRSFTISSIVISGLHVLFGISLLIMQLALAKYPLVRSRLLSEIPSGIAVNVSDLSVLIMYSIDLYWVYDKDVRNDALLIVSAYIRSWFLYVACCSYVLNCLRYLLILNFYRLMKQGNTVSKYQKLLVSKFMFVLVLCVLAVTMMIICIITLCVVGVDDLSLQSVLVTVLATASCVIAVLSGLICVILEMIANYGIIKKYGLIAYFRRDALYIRLQMLGIVFLIIFGIAYGGVFAFLTPNYRSMSLTYGRVFAYCVLYLLFGFVLRLIMAGAFICPIQIKQILFNKSKETSRFQFEQLMEDPECYELMYEYCNREFSLENLLLWQYLQELKGKQIDRQTIVQINEKYIQPYSPVQVNLPSAIVKQFSQLVSKMEEQELKYVEFQEMYSIISTELLLNLDDTLKRLCSTSAFRQWEHKHSTSKEMIEKQFAI